MPIRNTDQPEQFQPLGAPIRQEPSKPAPQPEPVGNGLWRSADGKLETRIPPPAISPAQRQGMWQRDARPYDFNRIKLSPEFLDRRAWQEERNKAATELVRELVDLQAADWLTITKQVQDLPDFQTLTDPTAIREEFAKDD